MSTVATELRGSFPGRTWRDRARRVKSLVFEAAVVSGAMLSEMPFLDHLEELRQRIFKCLIAMAIGMAACVAYAPGLIQFLKRPAADVGLRLSAIEATEIFSVYFKVAFAGGICLAAPFILWQIWKFIAPGLYAHERRYAGPFLVSTTICFAGGAVFGYAIVSPFLLKLQIAMAQAADIDLRMSSMSYLGLLTTTVIAMGAIFEMPPVVFILSRIGLVNAKFLVRNLKYAFLLFSVASAILTPSTEMAPMLAFMAVMTGVYAVSILVALVFARTRIKDKSRSDR